MICYRNEIENKLIDIILLQSSFDFEKAPIDSRNLNIFSRETGITGIDLICIFFEIENTFDIIISEEFIINRKFNTFNNICKTIVRLVESKQLKNEEI